VRAQRRRPAAILALGVGLLQQVSAPRAAGVRCARDPLGPEHIKRQAAAVRALHHMRPQGRDYSASGVGRPAHRSQELPKTIFWEDLTAGD
jgi:hypothetical protein